MTSERKTKGSVPRKKSWFCCVFPEDVSMRVLLRFCSVFHMISSGWSIEICGILLLQQCYFEAKGFPKIPDNLHP